MKSKLVKFAQVAAIGLALAFTFSCSSGGDDDDGIGGGSGGGGGSGSLGNNLTLSGQVYTQELDFETMKIKYVPYTGPNIPFTSNTDGTGSINGGKMSFSTGVPDASILEPFGDIDDDESDIYPDAAVQPSDTRGINLEFDIGLNKQSTNMDVSTGSMTIEVEGVSYIYVDRDCTITAAGETITEDGVKYTYQKLNLRLKKGWNTINMKMDVKTTSTSTSQSQTIAVSMNTGDLSSCKWVLGDDDDDDYYYGVSSKNMSQLFKMAKRSIQQRVINIK